MVLLPIREGGLGIKKLSNEGKKSQIDAVFELKLTDENKILDVLVKEQNLEVADLTKVQISDEIKTVLPSNYINVNFVAPFKVDGKTLHIAISDSSKLGLMRNLKAITKKILNYTRQKFHKFQNL